MTVPPVQRHSPLLTRKAGGIRAAAADQRRKLPSLPLNNGKARPFMHFNHHEISP